MILNGKDLAVAQARICMLKGRCDLLRRRTANPIEAQFARDEVTRIDKRVSELEEQVRVYFNLISSSPQIQMHEYKTLSDIPSRFIERRIRLGWSQTRLGQSMGKPRQTIARYERTRYAGVTLKVMMQIDLIMLAGENRLCSATSVVIEKADVCRASAQK